MQWNIYTSEIHSLCLFYISVHVDGSRRKQHATYYVWSLADFFLPCPDGMWVSHRFAVQESVLSFLFILAPLVTSDFGSRYMGEKKAK